MMHPVKALAIEISDARKQLAARVAEDLRPDRPLAADECAALRAEFDRLDRAMLDWRDRLNRIYAQDSRVIAFPPPRPGIRSARGPMGPGSGDAA